MKNIVLAKMIKEAREKKEISQRELARRTNIDNAEISRIEKGTRIQPNFFALRNLSKELNIDFADLMRASKYEEEAITYFVPLKDKEMPLIESRQWTEEEHKKFMSTKEDGIDLLMVIRKFRKGHISEDDFIYLLSKGLGVNVKEHFWDSEEKLKRYKEFYK